MMYSMEANVRKNTECERYSVVKNTELFDLALTCHFANAIAIHSFIMVQVFLQLLEFQFL